LFSTFFVDGKLRFSEKMVFDLDGGVSEPQILAMPVMMNRYTDVNDQEHEANCSHSTFVQYTIVIGSQYATEHPLASEFQPISAKRVYGQRSRSGRSADIRMHVQACSLCIEPAIKKGRRKALQKIQKSVNAKKLFHQSALSWRKAIEEPRGRHPVST
jgi:hypothetical protein